jgi:hypothetical protein
VRNVIPDDSLYLGMANPMNLMTDSNDDLPDGGWELICLEACQMEPEFVPQSGSITLPGSGLAGLAGYAGMRSRVRRKKRQVE